MLTFLGRPRRGGGGRSLLVGAVSGIMGVLFALAQHDIKRLLAYHSVENIGIICLGLGVGLLGMSYGAPVVAVLGFAGGLLHVLNHALFKGLLFLGAGAASHAAGTREIDRLGGLLKRMPLTGGGVPGGRRGNLRAPAAERLRERAAGVPGGLSRGSRYRGFLVPSAARWSSAPLR